MRNCYKLSHFYLKISICRSQFSRTFRCLLTAAFELIFHSSPDSPPASPKSVALSPQPVINSSTLCGLRFKISHRCTRMAGNKPQTPNLLCFCGKRVLQRRGNNRGKWWWPLVEAVNVAVTSYRQHVNPQLIFRRSSWNPSTKWWTYLSEEKEDYKTIYPDKIDLWRRGNLT